MSNYTNTIDIIVDWVNPDDKNWQNDYNKYYKIENSSALGDNDFNGACRYRDIGALKYWFRGVELNCPWVRKIFFVVASESQIPDWLNTANPKLRIVYHREYIPGELLPTFNSNVIEMFLNRLPDLSDRYILCNDDTYFMRPINEDRFFDLRSGLPKINRRIRFDVYRRGKTLFDNTLTNNYEFMKKHFGCQICFSHPHMQEARNKRFEHDLMDAHYKEILKSFRESRFRHENNFTQYLYNDSMRFLEKYAIFDSNVYANSRVCGLNLLDSVINVGYDMLCLNDSVAVLSFNERKRVLLSFLNDRFPRPSSFENPDLSVILELDSINIRAVDRFGINRSIEFILVTTDKAAIQKFGQLKHVNKVKIVYIPEIDLSSILRVTTGRYVHNRIGKVFSSKIYQMALVAKNSNKSSLNYATENLGLSEVYFSRLYLKSLSSEVVNNLLGGE